MKIHSGGLAGAINGQLGIRVNEGNVHGGKGIRLYQTDLLRTHNGFNVLANIFQGHGSGIKSIEMRYLKEINL